LYHSKQAVFHLEIQGQDILTVQANHGLADLGRVAAALEERKLSTFVRLGQLHQVQAVELHDHEHVVPADQDLGFRLHGSWLWIWGLGFRLQGSWLWIWGHRPRKVWLAHVPADL
jgi:hypothetical protein